MKLYHGTSFENACQILSKPLWRPRLFDGNLEKKELYDEDYLNKHTLARDIKSAVTFFTTNYNRASVYALKNERPVVLWWDCNEATQSGDYTFRYHTPIQTASVKALIGISSKIMFYGNLINAIFNKTNNKYIIKSTLGGIMTAPSKKAMKEFLQTTINNL